MLEFYYFNADSEGDQYLDSSVGLVMISFSRLSVDGIAVPKHIGVLLIKNCLLCSEFIEIFECFCC
jgi:hypothetical protein